MLEDTSFSVTKQFLEQHGVDTNKSSEIAGAIYLLGGTPKDIYANKDAFVRFKNKPEYVYMDTVYTTHRRNKSLYNSSLICKSGETLSVNFEDVPVELHEHLKVQKVTDLPYSDNYMENAILKQRLQGYLSKYGQNKSKRKGKKSLKS